MSGGSDPALEAETRGVALGIVLIGRNEGERLRACFESLRDHCSNIVYVDSGSTDGSQALAVSRGIALEVLDTTLGFTAARARNAGARRLLEAMPHLQFIQFVDGDCEVVPGWLDQAKTFLAARTDVAVVCGRRRERHPERSVYNRLCDIEWNTPVGEALACGGDAMMRAAAFQQVGGFRDTLIAGEEPELCIRLRAKGWKIWRLDAEMTLHDAAMTRFVQWWKRCMRAGFAYAEGVRLHGAAPEHHWVREARSSWLWGAGLPLLALAASSVVGSPALLILLAYPLQVLRVGLRSSLRTARWPRAFFLVAGKFPELVGQIKSWHSHVGRRQSTLIEYK